MRHLILAVALAVPSVPGTSFASPVGAPANPPGAVTHAPAIETHAVDREDRAPLEWQFGKGPPKVTVVFMHGLGGSPEGYRSFLKNLLKDEIKQDGAVKVIAPYMRPEDGPHTMTDQLARARAVIDAQRGPVILMGHSFGGKAALKLAQEYPENKVPLVIALAPSVKMLHAYWKKLTGESGLPSERVVEERLREHEATLVQRDTSLAKRLESIPAWDEDERDKVMDQRHSLRWELKDVRFMRDLAKHDERGTEDSVKTPTLVFHGTEDEAVSIHYARRLAEANPGSIDLVELPGVGHGFREAGDDETRSMAERIGAFVNAHRPGAAER